MRQLFLFAGLWFASTLLGCSPSKDPAATSPSTPPPMMAPSVSPEPEPNPTPSPTPEFSLDAGVVDAALDTSVDRSASDLFVEPEPDVGTELDPIELIQRTSPLPPNDPEWVYGSGEARWNEDDPANRAILYRLGGAIRTTADGRVSVNGPTDILVHAGMILCVAPRHGCNEQAQLLGASELTHPGFGVANKVNPHDHPSYDLIPTQQPHEIYRDKPHWGDSADYARAKQPKIDADAGGDLGTVQLLRELQMALHGYGTICCGVTRRENRSVAYASLDLADRLWGNLLNAGMDRNYNGTRDVGDLTVYQAVRGIGDLVEERFADGHQTVAHLGEGLPYPDSNAPAELRALIERGPPTVGPNLTIVHGMGFSVDCPPPEERERDRDGDAKPCVTWQELADTAGDNGLPIIEVALESQWRLYRQTTNVVAARDHGFKVVFGTDWSVTAAPNPLSFARAFADTVWPGELSNDELLLGVTSYAAEAVGMESYVGCLEEGCFASFHVVDLPPQPEWMLDWYVRDVTSQHIALFVQQDPLWGRPHLMPPANHVHWLNPELMPAAAEWEYGVDACREIQLCGEVRVACWQPHAVADERDRDVILPTDLEDLRARLQVYLEDYRGWNGDALLETLDPSASCTPNLPDF